MFVQEWTQEDLRDLQYARQLLEVPSFAAKVANLIGTPIERGMKLLPKAATTMIVNLANRSLTISMKIAVATMSGDRQHSSNWLHMGSVAATGALGGAFGLPGLVLELPISTTIMLRSIADIARSEGEDIETVESRLSCLEVFALGGPAKGDDAVESGYFLVRAALSTAITEAAEQLAGRVVAQEMASPLLRFVTQVGARFGVQVSEKVIAQALPLVGAAGGAAINTLFMSHFQTVARGHFIIRRLERTYGSEAVKQSYCSLGENVPHRLLGT